jgi:hypothetical protein
MLGSHREVACHITEDPDPLPLGFHTEPQRKCEFFYEDRTLGARGIAFAVLLRALEDGVNEKWLRLITQFYEVPLPEEYLARRPERRLRMNQHTHRVGSAGPQRITLTWFDCSPVRPKHLVRVA